MNCLHCNALWHGNPSITLHACPLCHLRNKVKKEDASDMDELLAQARDGDGTAQLILANFYKNGINTPVHYQKSAHWYYKAAKQGLSMAQLAYGIALEQGRGVEKNPSLAVQYYKAAVKQDEPEAFTMLGRCYHQGNGVAEDFQKALAYYEEGYQLGSVSSGVALALTHIDGKFRKKDYDFAFELLDTLEIPPSNPSHLYYLGLCHCEGYGTEKDMETGISYMEQAAEQNLPTAQLYLAHHYLNSNPEQAVSLFITLSLGGNAAAQYQLAQCYESGIGTAKNRDKMYFWFSESSENGHLGATVRLATMYDKAKNYQRAFPLYQKASALGHSHSQCRLGQYYLSPPFSDLTPSPKDAFLWLEKSVQAGYAPALYHLATCFQHGYGTAVNLSRSLALYQQSAEKHDPRSQLAFASCYEHGIGMPSNHHLAFFWYEQAALHPHPSGQFHLARCYQKGIGTAVDTKEALYWYRQSAFSNDAEGMYGLARSYHLGIGTPIRLEKAVHWYEQAALLLLPSALFQLALCHFEGVGTEQNYNVAFSLFSNSVLSTHKNALYYQGRCYQLGLGTSPQWRKAIESYQKSEELGNLWARKALRDCRTLSTRFHTLKERAVLENDPIVDFQVGTCLLYGEGTQQDKEEAFFWLEKSASEGHLGAKDLLASQKEQ